MKIKTLEDVLNDPKSFTSRVSKLKLRNPADDLLINWAEQVGRVAGEAQDREIMEARLTKKEQAALNHSLRVSRKKTKINLNNIPIRDQAQTPPYALLPLLPYLPKDWVVWESAAGKGFLAEAIMGLNGNFVIETDLLTGTDFFTAGTRGDIQVTNPPYSFPLRYEWIEQTYKNNQPFALLMPFETWAAARAQAMFQRHGVSVILINRRVNFYMPYKKWEGKGSDYPVAWFCRGLPFLREPVTYGYIPNPSPKAGLLPKWMVTPMSRKEIRRGANSVSDRNAIMQAAANPTNDAMAYLQRRSV